MKTINAILCFIAIGLLACNTKTDKISEHWFGSYGIVMVYGHSDNPAENAQFRYGVTIRQDSCTFVVVGFYEYPCRARENGNELHLLYQKHVDGFQSGEPPPLDTIATLIKEGERYYIKSSRIDDTDGASNKKLPLTKDHAPAAAATPAATYTDDSTAGNKKTATDEDTVNRARDSRLVNKTGTIWYWGGNPRLDDGGFIFYETGRWVDPLYAGDTMQGRKGIWYTDENKLTMIHKGGARGAAGTFTIAYKIKEAADGKTILWTDKDCPDEDYIKYNIECSPPEYVLCEPNVPGSCLNSEGYDAKSKVDFNELEKIYKYREYKD